MNYQFTVLLSTYKNDNFNCLKKALESLKNQSVVPSQIVIVVDGEIPLDNEFVISEFSKNFINTITLIKLKTNQGLGNALNEGLQHCIYDLVARMDADDECFFNRFEKQLQFLEKNSTVSIVGSFLEEFHTVPKDFGKIKKAPVGYNEIAKYASYRNPLNHPSVMFKKQVIQSVGGYKEISLFEDYYLWLRVLKAGFTIENISECLVYFKVGNDLIGRRHGFQYLKKEFNFLRICKLENLISTRSFYFQIFTRLPLRLLPKKVLSVVYKSILRV